MTEADELTGLGHAELPDVPFNLTAVEGRELDYVQQAIRGGHPSSGGEFAAARGSAARRAHRRRRGADDHVVHRRPRAVRDAARPRSPATR